MFGLFSNTRNERAAHELYSAAVVAARSPWLYEELGVPDTLDGRFDLIGLHTFLVIRRLQRAGKGGRALAQAVFDAMFGDMEHNLREMGVSDAGVAKRNKAMWEALHGRAAVYQPLLDAADRPGLADALARNVWRDEAPPAGSPDALAEHTLTMDRLLAAQPDAALVKGKASFEPDPVSA